MITERPLAAAAGPVSLLVKIKDYLDAAREAAADGLTWAEFGELLLALLRLVVQFLDDVATLNGREKKFLAMDAVARLFDAVADKAVPVVAWPFWLIARPAVRSLVLSIADGLLEQLLPIVRETR